MIGSTTALTEEFMEEQFETRVKHYEEKYGEMYADISTSNMFNKGIGGIKGAREWTAMDSFNLGEQLEIYNKYEKFCERASAADLGTLPQIAHDLISVTYAVSVAPLLAIIQTIGEEEGIVYYKNLRATDTRKDITALDEFATAKEGIKNSFSNYVSEHCPNVTVESTANATTSYAFTLANAPVRANKEVTITIAAPVNLDGFFLRDGDGGSSTGTLYSTTGDEGTIDYTTGDVTLELSTDPLGVLPIIMSFTQDFEKSDDIPTMEWIHTTTPVKAEILAVKETVSTFKSFQFNNRWGGVAEDEALMDLVGVIADAESNKIIQALDALADVSQAAFFSGNAILFDATVPATISEWEHRNAFKFRLTTLDSDINSMAGRGKANRYVAGHKACEYIASTPGFVAAVDNIAVGPHVYGYLDGKPVIRTNYIETNEVLGVYKNPTSPFEGATVCATFMPVFITNTMQVSNNPFQHQRATAAWKAFKGLIEQFVRRIEITNIP